MMRWLGLFALLVEFCMIAAANLAHAQEASQGAPARMLLGAHTEVIYENAPPSSGNDGGPFGRLTIQTVTSHRTEYVQSKIFGPCACIEFAPLSKLTLSKSAELRLGMDNNTQTDLLLVVGGEPRHTILRVIRDWIEGPSVAVLDIGSSRPELSWNNYLGAYVAKVEREELFSTDHVRQSYLFLYSLYVDEGTMAFVPTFGPSVEKAYLERYGKILISDRYSLEERAGQLIATLVASENTKEICRGLEELESRGLSTGTITRWLQTIPEAGFPTFDTRKCEEK